MCRMRRLALFWVILAGRLKKLINLNGGRQVSSKMFIVKKNQLVSLTSIMFSLSGSYPKISFFHSLLKPLSDYAFWHSTALSFTFSQQRKRLCVEKDFRKTCQCVYFKTLYNSPFDTVRLMLKFIHVLKQNRLAF